MFAKIKNRTQAIDQPNPFTIAWTKWIHKCCVAFEESNSVGKYRRASWKYKSMPFGSVTRLAKSYSNAPEQRKSFNETPPEWGLLPRPSVGLMEIKMRRKVLVILGALLIAGSTVQLAAASDGDTRKPHHTPVAAIQQFRAASDSVVGNGSTSCQNHEPGNPHNKQTDYMGWSSFRESGAWDSRNDCQ